VKARLLCLSAAFVLTLVGLVGMAHPSFGQEDPGASAGSGSFAGAAQAPIFQITEDEPSATFHPEGEGEFQYTLATLDPQHAHALSAYFWPGVAAGNVGTLAVVLGAPPAAQETNDPVRAEVTNTGQNEDTQQTVNTSNGTTMAATVRSKDNIPYFSNAHTSSSSTATDLNDVGHVDSAVSDSTVQVDDNGLVTVTARSIVQGLDFAGGVFHIGSVTSTATVKSDGSAPFGQTVFSGMTIGGQPAYVDSNGVHMGTPDKPANSELGGIANQALANMGMKVYFTEPATIPVGGVKYFYASSVTVFWAPPGSQNTFNVTLGGAAASLSGAGQPASLEDQLNNVVSEVGGASGSFDSGSFSGPSAPAAIGSTPQTPGRAPVIAAVPVAVTLPKGLSKWAFLVAAGLLVGGLALPQVPALFTAAAEPGCERERRLRNLFRRW
jgi:hypothetical protein